MLSTLRVITPPAAYAADLDLSLRHARIDSDAERDLFVVYLETATSLIEKYLGRALITQSLQWTISQMSHSNAWPYQFAPATTVPMAYDWALRRVSAGVIELPYSPVQAVTSVTIGEWGASDTTLVAGTDYTTDFKMDPARLRLDPTYSWGTYNHLSITYTAGYGSAYTDVPRPITNAIMMMALNLYENRGDDGNGSMTKAVQSLLAPYRITTYA